MIILLFGQPASGKTTLADRLFTKFTKDPIFAPNPIKVDGDRWRDITQNKDYSLEGRKKNIRSAFDMALYLEKEGYTPIISFVCPYDDLRQYLVGKANDTALIHLYYNEDRGRNDRFVPEIEEHDGYFLKINTSKVGVDDSVTSIYEYIKSKFKWKKESGM